MARGRNRGAPLGGGGVGPPPAAASPAIPRRITRSTSGALAAGNLRPPEATAGKQRPPGSAAAAVGKQIDLRVAAAPAPVSASVPVSASASAGLSKEEEVFVKKFLKWMNSKPNKLYKLYASDAELDWNFDGRRIELKTKEIIKEVLSDAIPHRQFDALDCKVQPIVNLNSSLLTVYGICDAIDRKPRIFVQTFVLRGTDLLIQNDTLTVLLLHAPEIDIPKKPQSHISKNHCAVCNEKWHSKDPKIWVECGNCFSWLHVECDPLCYDDLEILEKSNYLCPVCMSEFKSVLAVRMSCLAVDGLYVPEQNEVICQCNDCSKESKPMSMTAWERHCGCYNKKWKSSVYLKGTDQLLFDYLKKNPGASVKSSQTTAEINPTLSLKPSATRTKVSDCPALSSSRMMNTKSRESNFCILHDYDGMRWHQDKDKDHVYEKASRIYQIMKKLDEDGVLDRIASEPFVMANHRLVLAVHNDLDYLAFINSLPKSQKELKLKFSNFAGISLFSSKGTPQAVYCAAGAVIRACELVLGGYYDQAFAVIRPPGHHAHKTWAEGFCYFNNIAIGAKHLLDHFRLNRILVVDFDVHHGNGTQEIFYDNNHVLFFSSHCGGLKYPKSRSNETDIGEGDCEGYNINFPLEEGFNDGDLCYAVDEVLLPAAIQFNPEVVLVSAGFDAGIDDLGGCDVSSKGFGTVVRKLLCLAGGKMVLALEGGYNLVHLPTHVSHCIRAILGDADAFYPDHDQKDLPRTSTITMAHNLKQKLSPYWSVFVEEPPGPTPDGETPPRSGAVGGDHSGALRSHSSS